jgi:hypothetical protein
MARDDPVDPDDPQPGHWSHQQYLHIYILLQNKCDLIHVPNIYVWNIYMFCIILWKTVSNFVHLE